MNPSFRRVKVQVIVTVDKVLLCLNQHVTSHLCNLP